ncbi:MAG: hypothetical protein AYK18_13830 [Theionarchaea archaeon DG-70]|nr:MAG: hypothetical protein AYK18_13830 [Theionarchaea archaeon DG-70]
MGSILHSIYMYLHAKKNIDVYVGMLLAVILTFLGLLGIVDFDILAPGILLTLTLLLYSMLSNRRDLDRFVKSLKGPVQPSDVIKILDIDSIKDFVRGSSQVFMSGTTLLTRTNLLRTTYQRMLRDGCNLCFIVLDPESRMLPELAIGQNTDAEQLCSEIDAALEVFRRLKNYEKTHHTKGKIEFVKFNYVPTLTLMRTKKADTSEVIIHVELPAYRSDISERRIFQVTQADRELFAYFDRVCSELWEDATGQHL